MSNQKMSSRLFKIAEKPETGDYLVTWKCPVSSTTPVLKVIDLGQEIKCLLREGKITVHSVMSIWTGGPFATFEAFKMSDTEPNEIETKFSSAIFDIVDMLQSLMREDTLAFWNDGPKDMALKNLFPLAQDTAQLNRKLERITSTLENYAGELHLTAQFFRRSFIKHDDDDDDECQRSVLAMTSMTTKPLKSGNCFKIRRVVRKAWFALSRGDRKQIEDNEENAEDEEEEEEEEVNKNQDLGSLVQQEENVEEASSTTQSQETGQQASITTDKNEMVHFRPERNKSDSARCVNFKHFGGGGHCQFQQNFYSYQPRARVVPSPYTIEQMKLEQEQQKQQQQENEQHNCCCQPNNCHECPHHHHDIEQVPGQQDTPKETTEVDINQVHPMESQPFEVSQFDCENSYLQEYEHVTHHLRTELDLNSQLLILPVTSNQNSSGQELTRTLGSHNHNNSDPPKLLTTNIEPTTTNNNNNESTIEKRSDKNNNNNNNFNDLPDDTCYNKEVVVVRSAVSSFAESEYGTLDSEDMEWLQKIQEMGQTGHICADEIEQAEKLKRRSMFLNCIKYRVDEIHKDVTTVLTSIRQVEGKWVDPLARKKCQKNNQPNSGKDKDEDEKELEGNLGLFELSQLINIISQFCHDLVGHHHHHHHHHHQHHNDKPVENNQDIVGDRETILEDLMTLANETMTCHKSFKRFSKMVRADTNFLKDLCLSFPPIDPTNLVQEPEEQSSSSQDEKETQQCPLNLRPPNVVSCRCNFEEIFC